MAAQASQQETASVKARVDAGRRAIAHFYIHCPQRISKATITGASFREMLCATSAVPQKFQQRLDMCGETLTKFVLEERKRFKDLLRDFCTKSLAMSHGNPFAQGIHDCVTLSNGQKNLAVGISSRAAPHRPAVDALDCVGSLTACLQLC